MFGSLRGGYFTLLALVGGIWLSAVSLSDFPLTAYLSTFGRTKYVALWFMPPLLWLCWVALMALRRRSKRPLKAITRLAGRHRYWLGRGFLFGVLLIPLAVAFGALKNNIPKLVPYYADPILARMDWLLFLGHDPWRVSHALFGPAATLLLDRVYVMWFPSSAILLGCFLFTRDQRFQLRGLLAYVLTWFVLGSLLATLFASVGPVYYEAFYGSDRFAGLADTLRGDLFAPRLQANLLFTYGHNALGYGISAMPSLHVALAFLLYQASNRRIRPFALSYVALIWVASFHLGWHYAVDGLVSIVAVAAIWRGTGAYVRWLEAPRSHLPSPAAARAGVLRSIDQRDEAKSHHRFDPVS